MRILMVTSRMTIGGAESHIITLARELKTLGHSVTVASAGGSMQQLLTDGGIRHITLPLDSTSPAALAKAYEGLCALIDNIRPDVIHSHSRIPSMLIERYKTAKKSHIALVTTAHMPFSTAAPYKQLSEWGEQCIAVSEDIREYLIKSYSLPSERIHVINNGVEPAPDEKTAKMNRLLVRRTLGISPSATVYVCSSRSSESRCALCLYLCSAAHEILRDDEYLILCISGKAGRERDMTRQIRYAAKRSNSALGRAAVRVVVGCDNVTPYLCASDVYIGVSRAAMEAMANALPVIIAGNEGVGGIFCRENALINERSNLTGRGTGGSIKDVPRAIDALRLPRYRQSLGAFCQKYASEHFSAQDMAKRTLKVYEKATKKKLLLVGYYGACNAGDDAALEILREKLGREYDVYYTSKCRDGQDGYALPQTDIKRLSRAIRDSHAVIFGPGNLLQDETSLRSLAYYYAVFKEAKRQGRAVAFFSAGIGPLGRDISEKAARDMLTHADYVSVREPHSLYLAQTLTQREDIRIGADTVLLTEKRKYPRSVRTGERGYYVICPRGDMCYSDTAALRRFILEAEREGLLPVIACLDGIRDKKICRTLANGRYTLLEKLDAGMLLDVISKARFTISSRLHGAVLSAAAGVAFAAIDCDGRIAAFRIYTAEGASVDSGRCECGALWAALGSALASRKNHSDNRRISLCKKRAENDLEALREFLGSIE